MGAGSSTEQRSPEQPAGSDTPSELELSGHGPAAEAPGAAGDPAEADPATKVRLQPPARVGRDGDGASWRFPPATTSRRCSPSANSRAALCSLWGLLHRGGAGIFVEGLLRAAT